MHGLLTLLVTEPDGGGKRKLDDQLAAFFDFVKESGLAAAAREHKGLFVKHHSGITKYLNLDNQVKRTEPPRVFWLHGGTGTGKTRSVYHKFGIDKVYSKNVANKWFDNYNQEPCLLLDELRAGQACAEFSFLLTLTDRYPMSIEVKGASCQVNSPIIVITAPMPPQLMFQSQSEHDSLQQLLRRITQVIEMPCDNWETIFD